MPKGLHISKVNIFIMVGQFITQFPRKIHEQQDAFFILQRNTFLSPGKWRKWGLSCKMRTKWTSFQQSIPHEDKVLNIGPFCKHWICSPTLTIWYYNSTLEWSRIQTALMLNNQPMQRAGQYRNIAYPTVKLLLAPKLHGSHLGFTWLGQNFYGFPFFLHCYETLRGGLLLYWSHKGL